MSEDKTGTVRTTAFSNRIIWIFAVFMFFMIVGSLLASIGNGLFSSLICRAAHTPSVGEWLRRG